jgi:hypothetical protein
VSVATVNANGLAELEEMFPGFTFRHVENCKTEWLRWQCGRTVFEGRYVELLGGGGNGAVEVERFELIAYGSTREELVKKLRHFAPCA